MKKSLIALAFGTLGLGIAEFVMMGILPHVARDLGISIPVAGHLISAYALGVCVGAPMLVLARRWPLKRILLLLVALMLIGNLCASVSLDYYMLLFARFISGLPHGAYFGVASIVAGKLADEGRGSQAVSIMVAGMTIANLFGVPLGTSLSHTLSWRITFLLVASWSVITFYYIYRWIPQVDGIEDTGFKGQFLFLRKPAPWLILCATALGNGGVFCWYSYVNPMLTQVSGFSADSMTALMVLAGFGMVVGNLVSGRMSDCYTPGKVGMWTQALIAVTLFLLFCFAQFSVVAALLMTVCTAALFAVSTPEQVLIIRVASGGEMLGGACVQIAFNLGNAIGAYVGGLAVGSGYQYPALVGVPFACIGFVCFMVFYKKYQPYYR